jgi:hypothetical protein
VIVIPLAADSLGVRSMATYVEAGPTRILIDPGAVLAPTRFGLPPAPEEEEALRRARDRIAGYARRAHIVFVSHYHEEHYGVDAALYAGRRVLAKDGRRMIGGLQARRASDLARRLQGVAYLRAADGCASEDHQVSLRVSAPLPHGPDGSALGSVVALTVTDHAEGFRFVFASDVQGPVSTVATAYLIRERPHLVYLSGPPAYLEKQLGPAQIDQAIDNLRRLIGATGCRVIMDHYALRGLAWRERFASLWETRNATTAAGYLAQAETPLEAMRALLWSRRRKPSAKVERDRRMIVPEAGTAQGGIMP